MLGPVLERLHDELLDPLVRRVFSIMGRNRQLPPAPPAVTQSGVQVEFTSMLASAQKAAATGAIERFWQFGAQIGAVKPEALDRLDPDGTMDAYADMTGVPASILVDVAKAAALKAERPVIENMLSQTQWNRSRAAEQLGISYKTLLNKIKVYGIRPR